jgi:hypothetical protein
MGNNCNQVCTGCCNSHGSCAEYYRLLNQSNPLFGYDSSYTECANTLTTAAIAGIIIGCIAFTVVIIIIIIICLKKRKTKNDLIVSQPHPNPITST